MEARVPLPIRALVVLASVATPLIALAAALVATRALRIDGHAEWPLLVGGPAVVAGVQWLVLRRRTPVPRWIRAMCVLMPIHACLIAAIWGLWVHASNVLDLERLLPLTGALPIERPVAGAALILVVATGVWLAVVRGHGVPGWVDDVVRFLLVHLLALGLWVPLIAFASATGGEIMSVPAAWIILVPTTVMATLSVLAGRLRRNVPLRQRTRVLPTLAIVVALLAIVLSAIGNNDARWVYSNFGPIIVANAFLALIAINLLGLFHWLALRPRAAPPAQGAVWVQEGLVASDLENVGWVRCRGYLEGLRIELLPFHVRTSVGHLEVPADATLVAPLPLSTIDLERDNWISLLAKGGAVRASGYVAPPSSGPFRESSLPVAGHHVTVEAIEQPISFRQNAQLAIWRTCSLYLAVATMVAIPGIVASITYAPQMTSIMHGFASAKICGKPGAFCCGVAPYCREGFQCSSNGTCIATPMPVDGYIQGAWGTRSPGSPAPYIRVDDADPLRGIRDDVGPAWGSHVGHHIFPKEGTHVLVTLQLKPAQIQRGMAEIRSQVQACYERFHEPGMINIELSIIPDGRVSTAFATGRFAGTETGACVVRAVKHTVFPRFKGPAMSGIDYPFMLSK